MLKSTLHLIFYCRIPIRICLFTIMMCFFSFLLNANTYCPLVFFDHLKVYKKNILSKAGKLKAESLADYGIAYSEIRKKRKFTEHSELMLLHSVQKNPFADTPLQLLLTIWNYKLEYDKIQKFLLPLAKQHPDAFSINLAVANQYIKQKKDKDALNLLLKSFNSIDLSRKNLIIQDKFIKIILAISNLYLKLDNVDEGEAFWDKVLSHKALANSLLVCNGAIEFFAEYADKGPDGFFAGWSKRRYLSKLNNNINAFEKLWSTNNKFNTLTLRLVLKVFKQYNRFEDGERILLLTLLRNPKNSAAMLLLADYYFDFKYYMLSELTWQKIINSDYYPNAGILWKYIHSSDEADFYFQLGNAAFYAEDYIEAIRAYKWYLLLHPKSVSAKFKLGLVYMQLFDYSEAINIFSKISNLPDAAFYAALSALYLQDFKLAYHFFDLAEQNAIKLKMKEFLDINFYLQFAIAADKSNNFDRAESILIKLFNENPSNSEICNFLAYLWIEKNVNLQKAKILINRAIKKEPDNSAYLDTMAWLYYKLKNFQSAKKFILKAIDADKILPDAVIYEHAGDIFFALDNKTLANFYWLKALNVYSDDIDTDALKDKIDLLNHSELKDN